MKTVAEGVETQEEMSYVDRAGCDYVQGYFFSKPIRFEEMNFYKPQNVRKDQGFNTSVAIQ
jgi:EAL domain-containing protein (putative c-di-GMP-specific phosphodiesterase class I)